MSESCGLIERLSIPEVWTFTPRRYADSRGWFSETFNADALREALRGVTFVQDNQSMSVSRATLRGLHFQAPPRAQDKLVRVLRGSALDVAVDLRRHSPTYGRWASAMLSADDGQQMFIPKGFAHGFLTLEPNTEVFYKVSDFYSREHEGGVLWNDPAIGIEWGIGAEEPVMVDRDRMFARLAELGPIF